MHDLMHLVDDGWPDSHLLSYRTRLSGAEVTSPMEGVTGTMAWLGHMPRRPRGGPRELGTVYFFRFVGKLRLQRARVWLWRVGGGRKVPLPVSGLRRLK